MDKVKHYIDANKERFVSELFDLLRIPSVSAQSEHKPDMQRCAEWLAAALVKAGADRAEVMPTDGNPVVYAEKIIDPKAKTVLVYGHYDVMPVDPRAEWRTDPFEPVIENGRIRARGADDDKGSCGCTPRRSRPCAPPIRFPATSSSCWRARRRSGRPAFTVSAAATKSC